MKLRYLILKVKDLQRAKKFYIRFLNMQPTKEEWERMVVFDLKNIKVGLYNPKADGYSLTEKDFGNNCYAAFGVDDVWFEFEDSEGNILEIHKI